MNFNCLLPFFVAFILLSAHFNHTPQPNSTADNSHSVNAVVGDASYAQVFGVEPDASTPENLRLKTHLSYVISLLKEKKTDDLTYQQQENRAQIIDLLKQYTKAGVFPKNHYFKTRRPVFIDREGNLCAVGYLIAQTEGREAAERINRHHKFDYIQEINPKLIDGWLAEHGLSKREAAMIQPMYGPGGTYKETKKNKHIETEYAVVSSLLAGTQTGITAYTLFADDINNRNIYVFNGLIGLASLSLGAINIDNTRTESYTVEYIVCTFDCYERYEYTYKNPSRKNLSIANIVVGGASVLYNGIRFFRAKEQEERSQVNLNPTPLYDPNTGTTAPGLSLSMKF